MPSPVLRTSSLHPPGASSPRRLLPRPPGLTLVAAVLCTFASGCRREEPPPLAPRASAPLPVLVPVGVDAGRTGEDAETAAREAAHQVLPLPPFGRTPPGEARRLFVSAEGVRRQPQGPAQDPATPAGAAALAEWVGKGPALLVPDEDVFLAQAAPLLAWLDDAEVEVWLQHPALPAAALPVLLRDEAAFGLWLDAPTPGRVRVIQRADGFELQTAVGKLAGPDPNGPSVAHRGGKADLVSLRAALGLLAERFHQTEALCFVPSYGTELRKTAEALGANHYGPKDAFFEEACLVYPRPPGSGGAADAGG